MIELAINWGKHLHEMIADCKLDDFNKNINGKKFPITISDRTLARVQGEIIHFGRRMRISELFDEAKRRNLRHANLFELLALAKALPNEQYHQPIAGLGSILEEENYMTNVVRAGIRYFPYLYSYDRRHQKGLDLFWLEEDLDEDWAFAMISTENRPDK